MDLPHLNVAQLFSPVTTQVTYSSSGRHAHSVCYTACVLVCVCVCFLVGAWCVWGSGDCTYCLWGYFCPVCGWRPCVFTDRSRWSSFLVGGDKNMLMESHIGPLWTSHGSRVGAVQHTTSAGFPITSYCKNTMSITVFTGEFCFRIEGAHPIYIKLQ